ncbi:uncharacterized protein L201_002432 [Kwoniella dendrophila CBS 6074]|uniref:Uncharacterized protein n=1 Tax=Kwoniella dendrophila CBS 6074 TaxID=1295534 RepID=A0AAX4JQA2_9TREE
MFDGNNVPEPVIRLDRSLSLPGFSTMPEPSYPTFALSAPPTYAPLPADPSTYADQFAVSAGETSRGPFYGLPPPSFWATVPLIPNTPSQSSTGSAAPEAAPTKRKAKRSRKVAVPLTNTATLDMSRHGGLPGLQAKLNRGFRVRADAPRKQNAK